MILIGRGLDLMEVVSGEWIVVSGKAERERSETRITTGVQRTRDHERKPELICESFEKKEAEQNEGLGQTRESEAKLDPVQF